MELESTNTPEEISKLQEEFNDVGKEVVKGKRGRKPGTKNKSTIERENLEQEKQAQEFADSLGTFYSDILQFIALKFGKKKLPLSSIARQLNDTNFARVAKLLFPILGNELVTALLALGISTSMTLLPEFWIQKNGTTNNDNIGKNGNGKIGKSQTPIDTISTSDNI